MSITFKGDLGINLFRDGELQDVRERDDLLNKRRIELQEKYDIEGGGTFNLVAGGSPKVINMDDVTLGKILYVDSDNPIEVRVNGAPTGIITDFLFTYIKQTDTGNIASVTLVPHPTLATKVKVVVIE